VGGGSNRPPRPAACRCDAGLDWFEDIAPSRLTVNHFTNLDAAHGNWFAAGGAAFGFFSAAGRAETLLPTSGRWLTLSSSVPPPPPPRPAPAPPPPCPPPWPSRWWPPPWPRACRPGASPRRGGVGRNPAEEAPPREPAATAFAEHVKPFLAKHCLACHNEKK